MHSIIPAPALLLPGKGAFVADSSLRIVCEDPALQKYVHALASILKESTGQQSKQGNLGGGSDIVLRLDPQLPLGPEGYVLESSPDRISITGNTERGVFYGLQTLRQLLPLPTEVPSNASDGQWTIPCLTIRDEPRFAWRGAMLDSSRHLFSVDELQRFLDAMALQKLNVFHWHLADDQGWRLEIKKYPKLTEIGAWRAESPRRGDRNSGDGRRYGGFYTQEEIRSVVAYAAERFITVVPEIELPGHASAALASYPQFGNTDVPGYAPEVQTRWGIHPYIFAPKEETFRFLEDIFSEVLALFPSTYIHIGGDEAPKDQWKQSKIAQAVIHKEGLADEYALQSWFIRRIERFLNAHERRLIGWDEIQEGGLSPTATMMVWRDWEWARHALLRGNPIVMSPSTHCYLDHYQADPKSNAEPEAIGGLLTLEHAYSLNPIPSDVTPAQEKLVLGLQGNLWTEYIPDFSSLGYMTFPRLSALAEVGWTPLAGKNYAAFRRRLPSLLLRLNRLGLNFREPN